jgi:hypothetical protein
LVTLLPGNGTIKIEVWDYDPLFSDELIGYTTIDMEDRYYDYKWQMMKDKPIEKRSLNHPDMSGVQGWISLWTEVCEKKDRNSAKKWDISPPPTIEPQLRLIIWETEDIPNLDNEGTSDIYMVASFDDTHKQSTDIHYRCQTGKGSFNWRVVMNIPQNLPTKCLQIHAYDNDFFSYNDFISSSSLNITRITKEVIALDVPIKFNQDYFKMMGNSDKNIEFEDDEKFWLQLYRQNEVTPNIRVFNKFRKGKLKKEEE